MSLLDNLPHRCTIRRRVRTKGPLGGSKDTFPDEQTGVECWEQPASDGEKIEFQKRGMTISNRIFYSSDPGVTSQHEILITRRQGVAVASPIRYDVMSRSEPDSSAGLGIQWKVMVNRNPARED